MIDKWREPHGLMSGTRGIKADDVADIQELLDELGGNKEFYTLQSLERLSAGDLIRLRHFLDDIKERLGLLK